MGSKKYLREDEVEQTDKAVDSNNTGSENGGNSSTENGGNSEAFKDLQVDLKNAKDYEAFINKLNEIMGNPEQFKVFKAGLSKIDTTKVTVQEGTASVKGLFPTQSEIDASNSLTWFLNGGGTKDAPNESNVKNSFANLFSSEPFESKPAIIFNAKYVIDGHHRWSQEYCARPDGKISVINFKFEGEQNPIDALKRFQVAIAATSTGKLPSAQVKQGLNLYAMSEDQIREFVTKNMSNLCFELLKKYVPSIKIEEQAITYITKNCMQLKNGNKPAAGAPSRTLMPQTSGPAIDLAKKPMTDFTEGLLENMSTDSILNIMHFLNKNNIK